MTASPGGEDTQRHAQDEEVAGAKLHARLQQRFLDGGNSGGAAQQSVEGGNLAELLVAQQGEFFVGIAFGGFLNGGEAVFDKAGAGVALIDERSSGKGRERKKKTRRAISAGIRLSIRKAPQGDKEASHTRCRSYFNKSSHRAARPDPSLRNFGSRFK
jgi:hypothetical protein